MFGRMRNYYYRTKCKIYKYIESKGNGGTDIITHITYCTDGNAGDTVLSKCVRDVFKERLSIKKWHINRVDEEVNITTINEMNKSSMILIGGGGLFLPDTNENSISGWQWAVDKDLYSQINVPLCIYSVGYNYFRGQSVGQVFQENLIELVEKSSFFGLRNKGSICKIQELIPEELAYKVIFQPCTTTLIRKLYPNLKSKNVTNKVAVNVAFDRPDLRFGKNKELILEQIAEAVKKIELMGYKIYYVAHVSSDLDFLSYLNKYKVLYKSKNLSMEFPRKLIEFYNEMDLVIGMRGHAQLIPFGLNCEIITLGSHNKMRWFLEDIDATDWYVELGIDCEHLSERIISKFMDIHGKEATKRKLINEQEKLWSITMKNLADIKKLMRR